MNNKFKLVLAAGAILVAAQQSQAATFSDAQNPAASVNTGSPYLGSFNVAAPGSSTFIIGAPYPGTTIISDQGNYTPGQTVNSAVATFWFADDESGDPGEAYTIDLGTLAGWNAGAIPGFVVAGGPANQATILLDIQADGQLSYQINGLNDFNFDYALLTIDANVPPPDNRTPDGGATAMLLGLGSLGVAALRRKLS